MLLQNLSKYQITLVSKSPRRQQLLSELGVSFQIKSPEYLEEIYPHHLKNEAIAEYLSGLKAAAYPLQSHHEVIITADTIVCHNGQVLDKPENLEEARNHLRHLSGNIHYVYTGVSIRTMQKKITFHSATEVHFSHLEDFEIAYYVNQYKPLDKAGAYGIQELIGFIGVKKINGSFFNVMGLPVQELYQHLKTF